MRPTEGKSLERQKASLEAWYAAMRDHGLRDEERGENGPTSLEIFIGKQRLGILRPCGPAFDALRQSAFGRQQSRSP